MQHIIFFIARHWSPLTSAKITKCENLLALKKDKHSKNSIEAVCCQIKHI